MAPRKGTRTKLRRRRRPRSRLEELTERARQEGRSLTRKERRAGRRAVRAQTPGVEELRVRLRGTALETRRRMRPVTGPPTRLFAGIAPHITGALMFVIKLLAALILLIAEVGRVAVRWLTIRTAAAAAVTDRALRRHVTPRRTIAFVGLAAAVGLGASQFFDYHGVAVDAPAYAGEVGAVAPAPVTGTETAGSAHLWVLLGVAVAAAVLIIATYRGRARLAGAVSLCGLLGLAVALAIDLPQGLDAGRAGLAFSGSQAVLLQGFWAEVACSAVLMLSGGLLALYSRGETAPARRRAGGRLRRHATDDVGGISPGLQTES
jgi:hypothetical protein